MEVADQAREDEGMGGQFLTGLPFVYSVSHKSPLYTTHLQGPGVHLEINSEICSTYNQD